MKLCSLVADIEQIIGSECYNPNSYDGWNDIEGCEFRYPISIKTQSGNFITNHVVSDRLAGFCHAGKANGGNETCMTLL